MDEASSPASHASLGWKGQTCGYRIVLTSDEMRLEPIDGRSTVLLPLDADHATLRLGRSTEQAPNAWGIADPRVSREHVALSGGALQPTQVVGLGQHPVVLLRRGSRRVLRRGEAAALEHADRLYLVDEIVTPATGPSLAVMPPKSNPSSRHLAEARAVGPCEAELEDAEATRHRFHAARALSPLRRLTALPDPTTHSGKGTCVGTASSFFIATPPPTCLAPTCPPHSPPPPARKTRP